MNKKLIKISKIIGIIFLVLYLTVCAFFYFTQEKQFFISTKLAPDYKFEFNGNFEELNFETEDGITLNSLLFTVNNPKGLVFYSHGNSGSLALHADAADVYTNLGYDFFIVDYRGFGKSGGSITSEKQLYQDNQMLYDVLKKTYSEENIVVVGYSLGTTMASKLASTNNPKLLILNAPFYDWNEAIQQHSSFGNYFPLSIINKYSFNNYEFIQNCKMPVFIFHGTSDEIIQYNSSLKLEKLFKPKDSLILLEGEKHSTISNNPQFQKELKRLLEN